MQRIFTSSVLAVSVVVVLLAANVDAEQRLALSRTPRLGISSVDRNSGVHVTGVLWNTEAARLGLERGDVITLLTVNGQSFRASTDWHYAISRAQRSNGVIRLHIVDVNTGRTFVRATYLDNWE